MGLVHEFFSKLSKNIFTLFSYINYFVVIRKRILPNLRKIIPKIGADIIKIGFSENFPRG